MNEIQKIAESDDDERVRIELRPDSNGDGYELIVTNSNGTKSWSVPYEEAGKVIDVLLPTGSPDPDPRGFQ